MFTGLIEGTGTLVRIDHQGPDAKMVIRADFALEKVVLGESIAVDGACLTVVSHQRDLFTVDVSAETLSRTTLGRKAPGSRFNLERAMQLGDRLGGHLVSGHVDGLGVLRNRYAEGRSWRLVFGMPAELGRYVIAKGSIAINGISLTVNGCETEQFDVNIVPHTAQATTIGDWTIGVEVNLETDLIGKYVEKMVRAWTSPSSPGQPATPPSSVSADFLRKHGFMD
jgi:riboflavin synthase